MKLSKRAQEQYAVAHLWRFRIEDRGFDAAVCDKYDALFAEDPELHAAHSQYIDSINKINARMADIARAAQAKQAGV